MLTFQRWVTAARRLLKADGGRLWGISMAGVPWLAFDGDRLLATEDPGVAGFARAAAGIWSGLKPPELRAANTAIDWSGRRWATCSLPLNPDTAARLLIHEAWHAIQPLLFPGLSAAETEPGREIFDTVEGRVWLRTELTALGAALTSAGTGQRRAAAAALTFRARRYELARPEERQRETLLDITEGLAEYTAWRLTGAPSAQLAEALAAPAPASWTRAFCYRTGPAYGYLLDQLAPRWQFQVNATRDLQALLTQRVGMVADPELDATAYDIDAVRAEETTAQKRIDEIKQRFTTSMRLRIRPGRAEEMRIVFDPRQVWVNDEGTIYGSLTWSDRRGSRLAAHAGALVSSDWTEVWVPLGDAAVNHGITQGEGWKLELSGTWEICSEGGSVVIEPMSSADALSDGSTSGI